MNHYNYITRHNDLFIIDGDRREKLKARKLFLNWKYLVKQLTQKDEIKNYA